MDKVTDEESLLRFFGCFLTALLRLRIDASFLTLRRRNRGRGLGQRVETAAGLREGDDIADRVGLRQQGDDAVPTESDTTVRRGAVLEGIQQEAELRLGFLLADAHHVEHAVLDVAAVDTDGAAADLVAVADDVVGVGQRVTRVLVEGVNPFGLGRGERVVDGRPGAVAQRDVALGLGVAGGLEERSIDDPGESPGIGIDEVAALTNLKAGGAKQLTRGGGLASGEEDAVTGVGAGRGSQTLTLGLGDVLGDGATQRAVLGNRDVGQALGAARLGPLLPLVEGTTRLRTATGHHDGTHVGSLEHAERRVLEVLGELGELEAEAQVGLIRTVALHRVLVGHARDRRGQVVADKRPHVLQDVLGDLNDIVLVHEAHLDVELGELGLAVGAEVLVTVAARDLEVALHTRHHEQLLEELGRLGQGVPGTGRETCRDDEVAGALGGRTGQGRSLDLDEVAGVERLAGGAGDLRAQADRVLLGLTAQVEVAVLQASFLAHVAGIFSIGGHLERQGRTGVQDFNIVAHHLDGTGGQVRVLVALGASADLAGDLQDKLGAQLVGDTLVTDDNLDDTGRIAQVDERHATVIAATIHPTGERHGLTDQVGAEGSNVVSAKHCDSFRCYHPRDRRRHYYCTRARSGSTLAANRMGNMAAVSTSSVPSSPAWTPTEIGLAIGSVLLITLVAFEELAATTIMPAVVASYDAAPWYPIASGAALAAQLSATVVAGALADWKGPRAVLFTGMALFAVGLIISAVGPNVIVFVAGRALQGLGGGLLVVPLYVLIGAVAAPAHRPSFFAAFSLAWVLPSLVGPAIAGYVTQMWGWRYVFGVVPIVVVVAAIPVGYVLRTLPVAEARKAARLAALSCNAVLAGVGVMLLQLAGALTSPLSQFGVFLLGAGLTVWALPRLLPRGTFVSRPGMPSAILARLSALASQVGLAVMIPLVLQRVHGWSEASSAWWVTLGSITWSLGAVVQARVHDPRKRKVLPVVGGSLIAIGAVPVGALLIPAIPVWVALIGWLLVGLGVGLVHAPLSVLALEVTPEAKHGRVASWLQVADSAGPALELALVSVAMSAWAATATVGGAAYAPYWVIAVALAGLAVFAVRRLRPAE